MGEVMAADLAKRYSDLDALSAASSAELMSIEGVGPNIAEAIVDWFSVDGNRQLVRKFKELGRMACECDLTE